MMEVITAPTSKNLILTQHSHFFGKMIKAVVDIHRNLMAIDGELHADLEALLLEQGSKQENLWGVNLYLEEPIDRQIEYTALINIRPSMGNKSMEIENQDLREKIRQIVAKLLLD